MARDLSENSLTLEMMLKRIGSMPVSEGSLNPTRAHARGPKAQRTNTSASGWRRALVHDGTVSER